jgi:hypothetical protein
VWTAISEAAEMRPSLELLTSEMLFVADPRESERRIEDCGTDASCLASFLSAFDARYGLLVVLNFALPPPLIGVRLVDTHERRIVASFAGPAERDPIAAVKAQVGRMLDEAGHRQLGRVLVRTDPADAEVSIENAVPRSTAPHVYLLEPGTHRVSARREGHQDASATAEAKAGEHLELQLELPKIEETRVLESWWLWTIIGGAVVAGTVTAIVLTTRGPDQICVGNRTALQGC